MTEEKLTYSKLDSNHWVGWKALNIDQLQQLLDCFLIHRQSIG